VWQPQQGWLHRAPGSRYAGDRISALTPIRVEELFGERDQAMVRVELIGNLGRAAEQRFTHGALCVNLD
jgi:hypothetical protein